MCGVVVWLVTGKGWYIGSEVGGPWVCCMCGGTVWVEVVSMGK